MPDSPPDAREAARIALDHARWEVNHWARVITELPANVSEHAVIYVATPETYRHYTAAVEAEAVALDAWKATEQEVSVA